VPGRLKWLDVTLKRAITPDMSVWQWRQQFVTGDFNAVRKDFSIVLFDQAGNEIAKWRFSKGWPSKVELSNSGEMSSIETLLITHEGMERVK
jgi:phage tail-like protein